MTIQWAVFVAVMIVQEVQSGPACLPCDPGYGVLSECNTTHATVCQPCKAGVTYARLRSFFTPCKTCSVCGPFTFTVSSCTTTSNTVCISCFSALPPGSDTNPDYHRKCQGGNLKKSAEDEEVFVQGEEERLLQKQTKIGIIVASVVVGSVTSILGCFLVCRVRRRRLERCKNGNVYVEAPTGNRLGIEVVGVEEEDADAEAGLANDRSPLATANGHVPHSPPDDGHYELPIDIKTPDVTHDKSLKKKPLKLSYMPQRDPEITNTGDTVQINFREERSVICGGPLGSRSYRLSHCHFHWGSRDCQGSEHTVNGCSYPGELHLVHYETDKSSRANNAKPGRAVAILAVFFEVQADDEHDALALIANKLGLVQYKGESTRLSPANFNPASLLPDDCSKYWTYASECSSQAAVSQITWVVFKHPIEISSLQLESFRQLRSHERGEEHGAGNDDTYLVDNFRRPLAPPGEFVVTSSF